MSCQEREKVLVRIARLSSKSLYLSRHRDRVCSGERPEQLPGDVTLESSHDLLGRAAFASPTFDIGASFGINPHSHDDDWWSVLGSGGGHHHD